jgi:hypothetical protein
MQQLHGALVELGNFFFRYRNGLFPLFGLIAAILAPPKWAFGDPHLDLLMDAAGLAVILSGQLLRAITIGYEYIVRGGRHGRVYADGLVTGGVFAHSRNPLYLGNMLIFVGIALIWHSPGLYLVGLPLMALIYASIIAAEEDFLASKFGTAYQQYCANVNRLWPRWQGFRQTVAGIPFNWHRLISKEYNTFFGWVLLVIFVELWSTYRLAQDALLEHPRTLVLGISLLVSLAIYATVRVFKKKGAFSKSST